MHVIDVGYRDWKLITEQIAQKESATNEAGTSRDESAELSREPEEG